MIAKEWTAFKLSQTMAEVNSLLGRSSGARFGLAYEPLAEDVLRKGGQFVMKQLIKGGKPRKVGNLKLRTTLKLKAVANLTVSGKESVNTDQFCYFPVVDGWDEGLVFPDGCFDSLPSHKPCSRAAPAGFSQLCVVGAV
jgi:hypothetical protein